MTDSYRDALAYLYALEPRGIRLELDRVESALAMRGDPHRGLRFLHVAGSNGKGSVSAIVERALRAAGLRTGLYTSPHLHRFVERIRIDGAPIGEDEVVRRVESLRDHAGLPPLTFFEVVTIVAFEAFRDAGVDVVVLEVGLGGRLDATNVVEPIAVAITNVSLEHQKFLGERIEQIAWEKAGVLKPGVPAVTGADGAALDVIRARAQEIGAPLAVAGHEFRIDGDGAGRVFHEGEVALDGLTLGTEGPWARANAEVAIATLVASRRALDVPDDAIREGVRDARWAGRFERIPGAPEVLLDAAHNPAGCEALARALEGAPRRGKRVLLFGALEDKDREAMLAAFDGVVDERVYAVPPMRRAPDPRVFTAIRPGTTAASVPEGLRVAMQDAGPDGLVVVCGSIFVMAEARAALLGIDEDPKIAM